MIRLQLISALLLISTQAQAATLGFVWDANDPSDQVTEYRVYQDSVQVAATPDLTATIPNVVAGKHTFACTAEARGKLVEDFGNVAVQGPAPDPSLQQILTVNSTTIDVSGNLWWSLYSPVACKYRILPTAVKGSYPAFTIPATTPISQVIGSGTKFLNLSGCALAELSRIKEAK